MEDIKRCPFCGGQIEIIQYSDFSGHLECSSCYSQFESYTHNDKIYAIKRFNKYGKE